MQREQSSADTTTTMELSNVQKQPWRINIIDANLI